MRPFSVLSGLFLVVVCDAAIVRRDKRQLVPVAASCDMYTTCAPPAVCLSGHCQCTQPYVAVASSCVAAYPRLMTPVLTSGTALHYLQPQQPVYAMAQPAVMQHPPQPMPAVPHPPSQPMPAVPHPPSQPMPGYYPGHSVPAPHPVYTEEPQVTYPVTDGYPTTSAPSTTTTQRLYDPQPSIAYPGGFCRIPDIVCVGGSICENNVCLCRRGEEPVNGQCQRIEVPLVTESPTTSRSSSATVALTSTTSTTITATTTMPTTTTTTPTTTTPRPTTTTVTTTTTAAAPMTTPTTVVPTTTTAIAATTTTTAPTTTSQYIGREDYPTTPARCVNCCPPGAQNCPHQVIRINLSYPAVANSQASATRCQNSVDCQRGSFCRQGICR